MRIRPSRRQRLALSGVALLAGIAIVLAELPAAASLAAALFTALIIYRAWCRPAVVALRLHADGRLELRTAGQDWQRACLLPHSSVTPWLCVLSYRLQGKTSRLALYPDSLHPDDFRRLRVWLRWQARLEGDERRKLWPHTSTIEARLSPPQAPTGPDKKTARH